MLSRPLSTGKDPWGVWRGQSMPPWCAPPREIGNATGYIGNPGHADQENPNACAEGSDQRKMAVRVEFFENDVNDG